MEELKEPCKSAIKNGKCLGCVGLSEKNWTEPKRCPYIEENNVQISKNIQIRI